MSHFAKVVDDKVVQVIVAEPDFFSSFVDTSPGEWIQTSYNTNGGIHYQADGKTPSEDQSKALRKNYASIGFTYNRILDAFIPPKPYPSWILDEISCLWKAPIPCPSLEYLYDWNEETQSWTEKQIII